jgi:Staphylococcus phage HNH endonuclease
MVLRNFKHGDAVGTKPSPEWICWHAMRQRCTNKNRDDWENYGGRGIRVCKRWNSFKTFLADMGRKPFPKAQLDRKDNNGNYEPQNCKWSTAKQQANNRRKSKKT